MKRRASYSAVAAAAFAAALCAATAAQAFTFNEHVGGSNGDAGSALTDSDPSMSRYGSSSNAPRPGAQPGKSGLYFGPSPRSFDQRYDTRRMFDPLGRPGDTR